MRIGIDLRFWRSETGGVGRYSRNLLTELLKIDHENEYTAIITPKDDPEFNLTAPNLKKLVVPIVHYSITEQIKLPPILYKQKFDLVHFAMFNHPIFYRKKFVVTVHDMIMHFYASGKQKDSLIRTLAYKWDVNDCKRARKVIVPSEATKMDLIKSLGFPEKKIVVTPEGSESSFRVHTEAEKDAIRKKLNLPEKYLLFVSRWEEYKGLPALISAHRKLSKRFPELGLVICGKPDKQNPSVSQLVEFAKHDNPKVITPGFVSDEDLQAIYSAATVYVHPSWYEGFGIMILEAFASGVPVVTSNTSSLPEVVGDAGLLVDPRNVEEIIEKINSILANPTLAKTLVEKGLARVKEYSWKKMAEQTLEVYRQAFLG